MITIGNTGLQDIFWGSDKVESMFIGADQVYGGEQPISARDTWVAKTWNGQTSFSGGQDIFIYNGYAYIVHKTSSNTPIYILDAETSNWSEITSNIGGNQMAYRIWSDGVNIYYNSPVDSSYQLTINSPTNWTWTLIPAWNIQIDGSYVWNDGTNTYYSKGSNQYIWDITTTTWIATTWNIGEIEGNATYLLSNGDVITLKVEGGPSGSTFNVYAYILDKVNKTWSLFTNNAVLPSNKSKMIAKSVSKDLWEADGHIYISSSGVNLVYNPNTNTWDNTTWNGYNSAYGNNIWTLGNNIYFSNSSNQYTLT